MPSPSQSPTTGLSPGLPNKKDVFGGTQSAFVLPQLVDDVGPCLRWPIYNSRVKGGREGLPPWGPTYLRPFLRGSRASHKDTPRRQPMIQELDDIRRQASFSLPATRASGDVSPPPGPESYDRGARAVRRAPSLTIHPREGRSSNGSIPRRDESRATHSNCRSHRHHRRAPQSDRAGHPGLLVSVAKPRKVSTVSDIEPADRRGPTEPLSRLQPQHRRLDREAAAARERRRERSPTRTTSPTRPGLRPPHLAPRER